MLEREQDRPATLHSWVHGLTLWSYSVYAVAYTEAFHEIEAKVLLPLYKTADGGQGAGGRDKKQVKAPENLVESGFDLEPSIFKAKWEIPGLAVCLVRAGKAQCN